MEITIDFTEAELRQFAPKMKDFYRRGLLDGKEVLRAAGILDNGQRLSHFFGQFGAETGGGTILRESLHYTTVRAIRNAWSARARKHADGWIKANLLKNPVGLGDWAYGGRMGNRKGTSDGYDYRGGGYIQTTGKSAVERYCDLCGIPIRPDILDDPEATLKFACAEWQQSGCNELADANDLMGISKTINTGSATSGIYPNGMEHRETWFAKAREIWWDAEPANEAVAIIRSEPTTNAPGGGVGLLSDRAFAKVNDLADKGSRIAGWIRSVKRWFWGGTITTTTALASLDTRKGSANVAVEFIRDHPFLSMGIVVGITAVVVYVAIKLVEKYLITAATDGRYQPRGK